MGRAETRADLRAGPRADLRAPALAMVAWGSALVVLLLPTGWWWGVVALAVASAGVARLRHRLRHEHLAWLLAGLAVAAGAALRLENVHSSPVVTLAGERAVVHADLEVRSDPVLKEGRFSSYVLFRAGTLSVTGRGRTYRVRSPVLVIADPAWRRVRLGSVVRVTGRLATADGDDLSGVLSTRAPPRLLSGPGMVDRAAGHVRAGIRESVSGRPLAQRALVPALVVGDDQELPEQVTEDFRVAGLTHLVAVSGTNLTLVVGFLLILARWAGVRARALVVVGVLGVAGFVVLARAEPSVVRAAAMGSVALIGMGSNGRERGTRALGVAVLMLMLFDPWLATSIGFALSALATAGILFLAPGWRDALMTWLPRWVAEAISVPLAAQLACTPVIAAISGQVSLVAVLANLVVAPAVGPTTVLGLVGGLLSSVADPLGHPVGLLAGLCAGFIIAVADSSAGLPVAAIGWSGSVGAIVLLTVLCVVVAAGLAAILSRRRTSVLLAGLGIVVMLVPLPDPRWPPPGWVFVMCDVGQGDGLVLNAGQGQGVVVDAGPDPTLIDDCLDRLHISVVPLVVLSHFHADHVDGLAGVLDGRRVGSIEVTSLADPPGRSRFVRALAERAGVPVEIAEFGETGSLPGLFWQVLAPSEDTPPSSGSPPNDASIVLYVETHGISLLLAGDVEPPSQERLHEVAGGLTVDVLKVPHHGSRYQDAELIDSLGAGLALISVGEDNDYGHPAEETIDLLEHDGMTVRRTDTDGDLAVVVDGELRVVGRGHRRHSGNSG